MGAPSRTFGSLFIDIGVTISGLSWVQIVGCFWIIYGYFLSNRRGLWNILLVHAICGMLGIFIQSAYWAIQIVEPNPHVAFMFAVNELMWIGHESTVVIYSLVKLETVMTEGKVKKLVRYIMGGFFLGYAFFRAMIGYYRVIYNTADNPQITLATSCAFLFWGLADLVIFGLLLMFTAQQVKQGRKISDIAITILKSSLPRLLIIVLNTFVIVILGQFSPLVPTLQDINNLCWAIKGSYPVILLFDMMTTKEQLLMKASENSHQVSASYSKADDV